MVQSFSKFVVIGLSGGIDSSYSAYLLKKEGYRVEGVYFRVHDLEEDFQKSLERVEKVAKFLDIKLHILDFRKKFRETVFDPFVKSYINGETPNPCINCNREIKFGEMFQFAQSIGADLIATGHYLKHDGNFIYEAHDENKDQSYFLFDIDKSLLSKLIFPLSNLKKSDVKESAKQIPELYEIATAVESREICFVENTYLEILEEKNRIDLEGDVLSSSGEIIGKHRGYMHYTIGKRRGFTLKVAHEPHYVLKIIPEKNQIIVGKRAELAETKVLLKNLNMSIPDTDFEATVKLRFRSKPLPCRVKISNKKAEVQLFEPIFGLAKGQAGVFYRDGKLLGGGWIE
jgi:tRNA-specific 2-thiouridylase